LPPLRSGGGSRLEPAYFVLDRRRKSVSARSSSARRGAIRSDLPLLRFGGKLNGDQVGWTSAPSGGWLLLVGAGEEAAEGDR